MNKQSRKYIILICVLFTNIFTYSFVNEKADSLFNKLETASGKEKSEILFELSEFYINSNTQKALKYADECLKYSREIKYREGEIKALKSVGFANHQLGKYSTAIEFLLEAKALIEKNNRKDELANISISIGDSYFQLRQFDIAFEFYRKAQVLSEDVKDKQIYAKALNGVGHIYKIRNEFDKALENNEIALKIWEKYNDIDGIIYCTINKGIIEHALGENQKALDCYFDALGLKRKTNSPEVEYFYIYNNIAITYADMGDLSKSNFYYYKAMSLAAKLHKTYYISTLYINIARNYLELNNFPYAIAYTDSALVSGLKIKSNNIELECFNNFSNIYIKTRDFKKALEYKEKYYALKDSMFTEESRKRIEELEIQYDTENKQKMIAIQNLTIKRKDNQNLFLIVIAILIFIIAIIAAYLYRIKIKRNSELKVANQKLIESENILKQISESKDKLFSVIVHDLKNPFGTLISVTDFLEEGFHEISEEHKIQTVKTIKNSAQQTYEHLENLLRQGSSNTFNTLKTKK